MISVKYQYKDKFIINITLIYFKWNQINDTIKETDPPIMGRLYNNTGINYIPLPLLEDMNSIENLQKPDIGCKWFTTEETTLFISSRNFFNIDDFTLYTKGNACRAIAIPVIESTYFTMLIYRLYMICQSDAYMANWYQSESVQRLQSIL